MCIYILKIYLITYQNISSLYFARPKDEIQFRQRVQVSCLRLSRARFNTFVRYEKKRLYYSKKEMNLFTNRYTSAANISVVLSMPIPVCFKISQRRFTRTNKSRKRNDYDRKIYTIYDLLHFQSVFTTHSDIHFQCEKNVKNVSVTSESLQKNHYFISYRCISYRYLLIYLIFVMCLPC